MIFGLSVLIKEPGQSYHQKQEPLHVQEVVILPAYIIACSLYSAESLKLLTNLMTCMHMIYQQENGSYFMMNLASEQ